MNTKTRWMIAAAAAVGLAFVTVPVLLNRAPAGDATVPPSSASSGDAHGSVCDANGKQADLSFVVKDMDGKDVKFADYKGKVIILDFWATWCGPCKVEIPGFVDLLNRYRDKGLAVLGVSVDDPIAKLKPFAAEYKMNYPVLVGLGRDDLEKAYGPIWGLPTTFVIGRDGKICKKHTGMASKEQFEREVNALF
jgi:peroxiredoxin